MDVLELVRTVKPSGVKANYMHGKLHDIVVTFQQNMKCSQADAVVFAESLTTLWPFCSYKIDPVKNGYWQVQVEYKVKQEEIAGFSRIPSLQHKETMVR